MHDKLNCYQLCASLLCRKKVSIYTESMVYLKANFAASLPIINHYIYNYILILIIVT